MSFISVGIAGAALSSVGGMVSAGMQSSAANDAAQKQADAANRATDLQQQMYLQQRSDQMPWRQAGLSALYGTGGMFARNDGGSGLAYAPSQSKDDFINQYVQSKTTPQMGMIAKLSGQDPTAQLRSQAEAAWNQQQQMGGGQQIDYSKYSLDPSLTRSFSKSDFQEDPGYQFRMEQGQKALEHSAAARGGLQSGGFMKGLDDYSQGMASQEYQNAYNRFTNDQTNRFNRLSSLAGMGQVTNAQLANGSQNYANAAGSNMMGAANAQGAAGMAGAKAWGGAIQGLGNGLGQIGSMGMTNNWMQKTQSGG